MQLSGEVHLERFVGVNESWVEILLETEEQEGNPLKFFPFIC